MEPGTFPRTSPLPTGRTLLAGLAALLLASVAIVPPALAQGGGGGAGAGPKIAAVVDEAVITTQDLNDRLNLVAATTGVPNEPEIRRRLTQQVLRGYIDEKLQLREAERLGLQVTDADIDQTLGVLAQRNRLELPAFRKALVERGIAEPVLRSQLRGQIAWAKVVGRELKPKVAVTQDQVDLSLREAASGEGGVELLVSEILLPVDSPQDEARVLRDAQGVAATLRGGGDFAALARQVSVASSREEGGDLGWLRPATILPQLRQQLVALSPGGVSEPVASPAGVHIFKVRERRAPGQAAAGEAAKRLVVTKVLLAQVLLPLAPDAKADQVKAAQARAREIGPGLRGCDAVDAYARKAGSDGSGKLGWLDVKDLPGPLRGVVAGLEPGRASEPLRGPLGIQLLMVCDRQGREETVAAPPPPPPPPPPTRESVRQRLEEEQLERLAARYLRDLRKDAYIDLRVGA